MRVGYRKRGITGDKTICLPLPEGMDPQGPEYQPWLENIVTYRRYLNEQIAQHPELFPPEIAQGYWLDGFVESKRLQIKTRRILLQANRQAYQIHPDTVMPMMVGTTEAVEKGLYLRRYGVPYEGIAHVLGRSPMYWYRVTQGLSRNSLVGATVKDPAAPPPSPSGG